ncbi:hypothetical protein [Ramlibacter sp.]|uniref:hypothetical protein n=1 Tax=Ramlibacter sp. TaxID=1917967 RepID=UPI003D128044
MTNYINSSSSGVYLFLGVLLFCLGTLLGIPHGLSKRRGDSKRVELWRIAHLSTCIGGLSLICLALALERLFGPDATYSMVAFSAAAYLFCFACTLSGCLNMGWNDDRSHGGVAVIYSAQIAASGLSLVGVGAITVTVLTRIAS